MESLSSEHRRADWRWNMKKPLHCSLCGQEMGNTQRAVLRLILRHPRKLAELLYKNADAISCGSSTELDFINAAALIANTHGPKRLHREAREMASLCRKGGAK